MVDHRQLELWKMEPWMGAGKLLHSFMSSSILMPTVIESMDSVYIYCCTVNYRNHFISS